MFWSFPEMYLVIHGYSFKILLKYTLEDILSALLASLLPPTVIWSVWKEIV